MYGPIGSLSVYVKIKAHTRKRIRYMYDHTKKIITKTCLYNFDPLKPQFYIAKLGFTGVYIIFLISDQKQRLWVLVRTASSRRFSRVPKIHVSSRNYNYMNFLFENFHFLIVKFSVYFKRRVFVMCMLLNVLH